MHSPVEASELSPIRVGPLVRATSATSVTIWAEFSQPCTVQLSVVPQQNPQDTPITVHVRTVTVGERYYAAPQLDGLQPATWYTYQFHSASQGEQDTTGAPRPQCFRTLNETATEDQPSSQTARHTLRIAYGSCRKLDQPETDALSAFATWLQHHFEQREIAWPHLLLLIGDQIYADQPSPAVVQKHPHLRRGATHFADFALLYEHAWTQNESARQVLATIPTFMVFDDHEIINDWNNSPRWRAEALRRGHEQTLVDGLVAYWVYQGWGNLVQRKEGQHPLADIMQHAERSGEDALQALREAIKPNVHGKASLSWHYQIPTTPPIFVTDARSERTTVFTESPQEVLAPTCIMSQGQMNELRQWMHEHDTTISIFVSSVPVILPPLIGFAEYLMGLRLWQHNSISPLRWLGLQLARLQLRLAIGTSFDHWPVYSATWHELLQLLDARQHDMLALSGDVHFSYTAKAQRTRARTKARLYQFVSTPLQNALDHRDSLLIRGQALLKRLTYSALNTRILPLHSIDKTAEVHRDLLFRNTLACIRLQPDERAGYHIQHEYLGIVNGQMEVIGSTQLE